MWLLFMCDKLNFIGSKLSVYTLIHDVIHGQRSNDGLESKSKPPLFYNGIQMVSDISICTLN